MDYTGLVSRAIAVIRRARALWVFAIIVALVEPPLTLGGGGTPGFNLNFQTRIPVDEAALVRSLISALVTFLLILGIWLAASFFVAPLARGAIAWAAWRGAAGDDPGVFEGLSAAGSRYGPLLLVQFLNLIVPTVALLSIVLLATPVIAFIVAVTGDREPRPVTLIIGILSLVIVLIVVVFVVAVFVLAVSALLQSLVTLASIDIIIEGHGAGEALRAAWRLVANHLGAIVLITVVFALLSGILSSLAAIPMAALFLLPAAFAAGGGPPIGLIFAAILVLFVLTALLQTPVQALRYTYFTLLYEGWTGRAPAGVTSS